MDAATDRVGLVKYSVNPTLVTAPTTNFNTVRTGLKGMAASGNTNQRMGTFLAIKTMAAQGYDPTKTINAIIVMTDGQFNTDGDPLAANPATYQWTEGNWGDGSANWYVIPDLAPRTNPEQNLARYALDNNIKIYTVTFGVDPAIQPGQPLYVEATTLAETTGGHHYAAKTGYDALDVYTKIAGELKETAGGDTTVALNFNTIKVNDIMGGGDVRYYMKYVPVNSPSPGPYPSDSTYLNKTHWFTSNNTMSYYATYPRVEDDTTAWDNRLMSFTPGDIKLNDSWSANFRLKLNASGKIELFGPGTASQICFTDASTAKKTCQFIPALQCNIQESLVNQGIGDEYLFIGNLTAVNTKEDPNILKIQYNVTYTGTNPMNTVTETIWYKPPGGQYKLFDGGVLYDSKCFEHPRYILPDTTSWPSGTYSIQVRGKANDSNGAGATTTWTKSGPNDINYIQLE
jgi:hypothetical protein